MEDSDLKPILETLLFVAGAPQNMKKLAKILKITAEKARELCDALAEDYKAGWRGLRVIRHNDEAQLATAPEYSQWVSEMTKLDFEEGLSRASLETLAIVAYRAPISRSGIDLVRGVDSSYTLRTLLLRGLIERYENPADQRSYLYRPTFDFVRYLGVEKIDELPDFSELSKKLEKLEGDNSAGDQQDRQVAQNRVEAAGGEPAAEIAGAIFTSEAALSESDEDAASAADIGPDIANNQ